MVFVSAREAGLIACRVCHLVADPAIVPCDHAGHPCCPRCHSPLHSRKHDSLARAWALTLAAAIFYVPANMLPIMTVISFGSGEPDTILSGVEALLSSGMFPIAALVFVASIFVPIMKLALMVYLMLSIGRRSQLRPRERALLYRLVELVGRWSMVDIFMISLLAALVRLDAIATIEPGAGAVFFASVVVLTMFAANSLDPRLIWDAGDDRQDGNGSVP